MSALCCAAPGLTGAPNGNGSSQSVYYPFTRSSSYSYIDLNPYAAAAAAAAAAMETATRQSNQHYQQHQQQPSFAVQQQQQQQISSARRRKRLEHAVTEAIPSASSGKVSQRIAQLQHSLTTQSVQQRSHPLLPASAAPRPLSLDPGKDYSQPLTVDCSIEYDLPRVARPPPNAEPLLLIAPRREPAIQQSTQQQPLWSQVFPGQASFVQCAGYMDAAPVSSCSSDSGRGTDSERTSSPAFNQLSGSWMQPPPSSWMNQRIKVNYQKSVLPVQPRPADAMRSQRNSEASACPCCPRPVPQRWAPYTTTTARHACPAPPALQQANFYSQQQQQQQQQYNWARWNQQHDQSFTYLNNGSSSLMAFHV